MCDSSRTHQEPIEEISALKRRIHELEQSQAESTRTEEALRKSELKHRLLIENSHDIIYTHTADGIFLFVSPAWTDFLGHPVDQVIGEPFQQFIHPDDVSRCIRFLERVASAKQRQKGGEYRVQHLDGSWHWHNSSVVPLLDEHGNVTAFEGIARDITERKLAEEALRASDRRYQTIFETTGTAMLIIEEDMTISLANQRFENLTGHMREEVEGKKKWTEFVEKDDLQRMIDQHRLRRTDPDRALNSYEFRLVTKDGQLRDVLLVVHIIPDTNKSVASLIDITERNRAEALANYQRQLLRQVIDADANLIFVKDRSGRFLLANKAMAHAYEASIENIIGKTDEELGARPDEAAKRRRDDLEVLETGRVKFIAEESCTQPSGELHYYQASKYPLAEDNGEVIAVLGVCADITGRKRMEESLRQSEALFRTSLEMAPDGVYMNDLEGNFLFCNYKAEEITGYTREELAGRNLIEADILTEDSRAKAAELLQANIEGRSTGPDELELVRKDGRRILVEMNTTVLRHNNQKAVLAFVRDITERRQLEEGRKRLEERLRQAEKMEALGQLAGGVAHDLNNVLGAVIGYSELLLMAPDGSTPKRSHLLNIMKGGEKASAIVQDLLTLTRRGVSSMETLNLNKIIADCQQSPEFERLYSYHPGVRVETDLQPDLSNMAGSPVHLGKSLFNLISNASEAMAEGGVVTVTTANQYLDKAIHGYDSIRTGEYVVVSVSDTGAGIPEADLGRIFEPFFTKKTLGRSGTGLGLTVVWGTVQDHDGYITVESKEGKGTIFTLYFPATQQAAAAETVAVSISEYMGRGESILVVDDVEEQRDLAADMLGKLDYHVATVSSGEEALAYLQNHSADLVVLDMIMDPGMDGLDTYRNALKIRPKLKAILVSGFSESDKVREAQTLGAGAYVRKPYAMEKLGMAARKELDRK